MLVVLLRRGTVKLTTTIISFLSFFLFYFLFFFFCLAFHLAGSTPADNKGIGERKNREGIIIIIIVLVVFSSATVFGLYYRERTWCDYICELLFAFIHRNEEGKQHSHTNSYSYPFVAECCWICHQHLYFCGYWELVVYLPLLKYKSQRGSRVKSFPKSF